MGGGSSGWAGTVERGGSGFRVRHSTARHSTAHHSTPQQSTTYSVAQHITAQHSTTQPLRPPKRASLPPSPPPSPPSLPSTLSFSFLCGEVREGMPVFLFQVFFYSRVLSRLPAYQGPNPKKKIGGMLLRSLVSSGGPLCELFTPLRELFDPSVNCLPPSVNYLPPSVNYLPPSVNHVTPL